MMKNFCAVDCSLLKVEQIYPVVLMLMFIVKIISVNIQNRTGLSLVAWLSQALSSVEPPQCGI